MSQRALTIVVDTEHGPAFEWADLEDRGRISDWMVEDTADHRKLNPDLFLEPRTESLMFGDEQGDLLALRISRVMRVDIQFNPDPAAKERLRACLLKEFPWLKAEARKSGFRQLMFDSINKPLIAFCRRRFGFKPSPDEYITGV